MSIAPFIEFLNKSPTAWHAVENVVKTLTSKGFHPIAESEDWSKIKAGQKYLTTRNGSSLLAFITPTGPIKKTLLFGSHTDSPALKLKPQPLHLKDNLVLMALEVYGAPLLTSWFNRDLGIAGRVIIDNGKGGCDTVLVNVTDKPVMLAQLAIHLDRDVNEKGFVVNKQDALNAIVGIGNTLPSLNDIVKIQGKIIAHDLFLYPLEPACKLGAKGEFLAGYRIDNLASVFASAEALSSKSPSSDTLQMIALWDHEEIGSQSHFAAGSSFVRSALERLSQGTEAYHQMIAQSLCLSIDLAHATHPNFNDKHEPRHPIRLGGGVVLKHSAAYRYATDGLTASQLIRQAESCCVPLQQFVTHGNIPAGSTIGPIHAGTTGMATLDLGIPQLSMHSVRELIAVSDLESLQKLLAGFNLLNTNPSSVFTEG